MAGEAEAFSYLDPLQADLQAKYARKELDHENENPLQDNPPRVPPKDNHHKRKRSCVNGSSEERQIESDQSRRLNIGGSRDGEDVAVSSNVKRQRVSDWPLRKESLISGPAALEASPSPNLPSLPPTLDEDAAPMTSPRSSRFIEGSMNDRVSRQPPAVYIEPEDAISRYHEEGENGEDLMNRLQKSGLTHHRNESIAASTTSTNKAKGKGLFRLSKALSSTFNLFHWGGSSSQLATDAEQRTMYDQKTLFDVRQAKAAEAYAKLKEEGFKGTSFGQAAPKASYEVEKEPQQPGLEAERLEPPKTPGQPESAALGVPPPTIGHSQQGFDTSKYAPILGKHGRSESATGLDNSPHKPAHTRKQSFQDLKKAISNLPLPVNKRSSASAAPSMKSVSQTNLRAPLPSQKKLKHLKELSRQESNLEEKLEKVRKEISKAKGEALPPVPVMPAKLAGRRDFVPGVLPSLPSERLLNQYNDHNHDDADDDDYHNDHDDVVADVVEALECNTTQPSRQPSAPRFPFVHPDRQAMIKNKEEQHDLLDLLEETLEISIHNPAHDQGRLVKKRKVESRPITPSHEINSKRSVTSEPPDPLHRNRRSRSLCPPPESREHTPMSTQIYVDNPNRVVSVSPGKEGNEDVPPVPSLPDHLRLKPVRIGSGNIGRGSLGDSMAKDVAVDPVKVEYEWDDEIF